MDSFTKRDNLAPQDDITWFLLGKVILTEVYINKSIKKFFKLEL